MSDKTRLETLEKQVALQNRLYQEIVKALEEAHEELSSLDDKIEEAHTYIFNLEQKIDSHKSGNEGKQFLECPNTKVSVRDFEK